MMAKFIFHPFVPGVIHRGRQRTHQPACFETIAGTFHKAHALLYERHTVPLNYAQSVAMYITGLHKVRM